MEESNEPGENQFLDPVTGKTMGASRLSWIIKRGDLALPSPLDCHKTEVAFNFREHDDKFFNIAVFKYTEEDDDPPLSLRQNNGDAGM